MNFLKIGLISFLLSMAVACTPKVDDGKAFVGAWHTAPISEKVSKQLFLDITRDSANKYIVEGYWVSPGTKSGKVSNVFMATNGSLVGPGNDTFNIDSNGTLHADGMAYNK